MKDQSTITGKKPNSINEFFEGLQIDQMDIDTVNYVIGQLVIENLKARLSGEDFTDSGLTRNDLAELGSVLAKLNRLKLYLPKGV
jgi:hypothetical protein